jgi:predicted NBD/HSP70 family sugar kinase
MQTHMAKASRPSKAGASALRTRSEELVLRALQQHGYAHARGFRDESFEGLALAKLAELAGLSRPSVYNVQEVYDELLLEPLRLRPDVGFAVGVENGPRNARVAIADIHGQLFEHPERFERYFELLQAPEEYLDWIAPKIDELVREAGVEPRDVMGVGISQVAPINTSTGHPHPSGLVNKAWRDVNVGDQLARRLVALRRDWEDVPTGPSDNDTNLRALAEHTFGSAQNFDDVLFVNWSNHVGFGLILRGQPYRGSRGYAGELGHLVIDDDRSLSSKDQDPCLRCGKVGCLEARIGAARLAEEFGAKEEDLIRAADYVLDRVSVRRGGYAEDERLRVHDAARLLGESVASIVDTLDPAALILGGSFGSRIHDDTALLRAFREGLEERMMGFAQEIEIRQPRLLTTAAVQGACLRVLHDRLFEWAQKKVAATTATTATTATPKPKMTKHRSSQKTTPSQETTPAPLREAP